MHGATRLETRSEQLGRDREEEMFRRYEVFDPFTGETRYAVPFEWIARLIAKRRMEFGEFLDYGRAGEGWLS